MSRRCPGFLFFGLDRSFASDEVMASKYRRSVDLRQPGERNKRLMLSTKSLEELRLIREITLRGSKKTILSFMVCWGDGGCSCARQAYSGKLPQILRPASPDRPDSLPHQTEEAGCNEGEFLPFDIF